METAFKILDVLDVLATLLLLMASVVAAFQCAQKKLSATGAWVLVAGVGLMLVASTGFAGGNLFLADALGSDNYKVYRVVMLLFYLVNLLGLATVGAGLAMFKPKPAPASAEVLHG